MFGTCECGAGICLVPVNVELGYVWYIPGRVEVVNVWYL